MAQSAPDDLVGDIAGDSLTEADTASDDPASGRGRGRRTVGA